MVKIDLELGQDAWRMRG